MRNCFPKRLLGAPFRTLSKLYDVPVGFVHPRFWGCVLLYLRSPKGGCCSISDDLSCFGLWVFMADVAMPNRRRWILSGTWSHPWLLDETRCPWMSIAVYYCLPHGANPLVIPFYIFHQITLNLIHSFEKWPNFWHVTIILPIISITPRNKNILHSHWHWFVDVRRGVPLLVPQWQCIRSFLFYIFDTLFPFVMWSW